LTIRSDIYIVINHKLNSMYANTKGFYVLDSSIAFTNLWKCSSREKDKLLSGGIYPIIFLAYPI